MKPHNHNNLNKRFYNKKSGRGMASSSSQPPPMMMVLQTMPKKGLVANFSLFVVLFVVTIIVGAVWGLH